MRRRLVLLMTACVVAGAVSLPVPVSAAIARVKATTERTWSPSPVRISKGDRVVFKNPTTEPHDFKPYKGPWKSKTKVWLYEGESVKRRFTRKGTYYYRCALHAEMIDGVCDGMCGVVRVRR